MSLAVGERRTYDREKGGETLDPNVNPDYIEIQAIIQEHMQQLINQILAMEENKDAYTPPHSCSS
jgi:paraquat-inducible protein B